MIIPKNKFTHKIESYVIYIFAVQYKNDVLANVKYFFRKNDGEIGVFVSSPDKIAEHIYFNHWQAWAGKYDEEKDMFFNAAKVIPNVKNGKIFLSTISDDYKLNNLEHLPRF